jgi:VWFA-related protein
MPSFAQAPPPAPTPGAAPAQQQAPLRVTTRLVQINVIAQDKKGEPVADLTRDDFSLLDQGQPQQISSFSVESTRTLPAPAQPLPANFYSNRLEQKAGAPTSVTVILLDGLNTKFEDMAYARQQIIKFLGQLQPQDRVALYTLTTSLKVLHDFTSDASSLLRAIQRYRGHSSAALEASEPEEANTGNDQIDRFLNDANQRMADFYTIDRVRSTAGALEDIANHLVRVPGRKNLIWVSGSFPFYIGLDDPLTLDSTRERRTFTDEVERAARALNNANLAIYPVDARGLIGPATANPALRAARGGLPTRRGMPPNIRIAPSRADFDTMNVLAERTGGRAFYNTNDILGSIRRAIEDSRVTYVLGYYPAHGNWDGKFHEIKLQVKRPGLHLRYRRGYFALPDVPLDIQHRQALLYEAVASPLDATSLGLNVHAIPVDVPGARMLKTELQIPPHDITLDSQSDRWVGAVDLLFVQLASDGKTVTGETKTVNMRLTRQTYEEIMKAGVTLTRTLPIEAGAATLRVVVRDAASGAIGSISIPLAKLFPESSK